MHYVIHVINHNCVSTVGSVHACRINVCNIYGFTIVRNMYSICKVVWEPIGWV